MVCLSHKSIYFKYIFNHSCALTYLRPMPLSYETLCSIRYHLYNLKNMENTHGGVLLLVKQQATIVKVTLLHGCFPRFLNCTNDTKSRNTSQSLNVVLVIMIWFINKFGLFWICNFELCCTYSIAGLKHTYRNWYDIF